MGSFGSKWSVTVFAAIGFGMAVAFFGVVLGAPPPAPKEEQGEMEVHLADKIKWQDGPASLPKGAMIAVLEGDPAKEGPFVFRIKLPDGFRVQPHTHPKSERVTVISGTLMLGMGDKFDEKAAKEMPAGAYGYWPAGMKHFAWSKGETILQLHGTGPWSVQYLNPDDDPRNQKK
jgi:quercetin dioxygenase-like cupin family protein